MQTWEVPWASMRRSLRTFQEAGVRVKVEQGDVSSGAEWRGLEGVGAMALKMGEGARTHGQPQEAWKGNEPSSSSSTSLRSHRPLL